MSRPLNQSHPELGGMDVSRETLERLKAYQELLIKWQSKINLVGPDTITNSWQRHFLDSLQLLKVIPDLSQRSVDFGTGAGFPGMVLAIAGAGDMHLVESDARKIAFLKEVSRVTSAKVYIHHCRIEECAIDNIQSIFSRACSPLSTLFAYSSPYVSRETICYFHKGKNYPKELLDANKEWLFDYTLFPSITDALGVVLKIENLRKK